MVLAKKVSPGFHAAVCGNLDLFIELLCMVNIGLRLLTKEGVTVKKQTEIFVKSLFIFILASCSTVTQTMDPKLFYKRDVGIEINAKTYEGVVVVPRAPQYEMVLTPKGDIDLLLLRSCHREFSGEKLSPGWFGKNKFKYVYQPTPGLEDVGTCPVRVDMYESKPGRNSWAFLDFEHPDYQLQAFLNCNANSMPVNGVAVCQAKYNTIQRIRFYEPVQFAPPKPDTCNMPHKAADGAYEWEVSLGECLYHVRNAQGVKARMTVIGYEGVLVREAQ